MLRCDAMPLRLPYDPDGLRWHPAASWSGFMLPLYLRQSRVCAHAAIASRVHPASNPLFVVLLRRIRSKLPTAP